MVGRVGVVIGVGSMGGLGGVCVMDFEGAIGVNHKCS